MIYMSPRHSEEVDIFLAGPQSQLGSHFDMTDAFTLQLCGERKWLVDTEPRIDEVLARYRPSSYIRPSDWHTAEEVAFQGPPREIVLRPGDALYVPAYAIHRVTGVSWSVSVNLGVRAFNEIDFVDFLLDFVRMTHYTDYKPVPTFPETMENHCALAKMELLKRVRALLHRVEMTAVGSMLASLTLPPTFNPSGVRSQESGVRSQNSPASPTPDP
jgi:ribosomal protein L16 Arg81 hydroxylase